MKTFDQKVRSMQPSEIIQAMVDGLRYPKVEVRMNTFGEYASTYRKCFGCAATNTICEIAMVRFTDSSIEEEESRAKKVKASNPFINHFEIAIDNLRIGQEHYVNFNLELIGVKPIKFPEDIELPCLDDDYTDEDLQAYERLAEYNRELENKENSSAEEELDQPLETVAG